MSEDVPREVLVQKLERLELLYDIGIALSVEQDRDRLLERILLEAKKLCSADGGTLYLRGDDDALRFEIVHTDSLGIKMGGHSGERVSLAPIPMFDPKTGEPNRNNVVTHAALLRESVNIPDAYDAQGFDFTGTKRFDAKMGYRSSSFLTIPMENHTGRVIGVLQLINARSKEGKIIPFGKEDQRIVEALASQAAIALDNQILLDDQKKLLEAFIQMLAAAIDSKSPYTGAHCERVPELTFMLTEAAAAEKEGPFADFDLDEAGWYELKIAAWLHDCGKVTTPVHVMDKSTKLETINDRIHVVEARFEVLKRDARIVMLEAILSGKDEVQAKADYDSLVSVLGEELSFLQDANLGSEFLSDQAKERIGKIGGRRFVEHGVERALLSEDELENLTISRGTLTEAERLIINGHMVQTLEILEALPFPRTLRHVPEYAGGHHERMDGKGYPRGIHAGNMSVPARIMAIADVFEALTAQDRPYKKGKTLSESMRIMGYMKRDNHLDPELLDLFVRSGVYKVYAERFLPPSLIDEVDEEALLTTRPKDYELLDPAENEARKITYLKRYEPLRKNAMGGGRS